MIGRNAAIKTLKRRLAFLRGSEYKNDFDKAEIGALSYAIEVIEKQNFQPDVHIDVKASCVRSLLSGETHKAASPSNGFVSPRTQSNDAVGE